MTPESGGREGGSVTPAGSSGGRPRVQCRIGACVLVRQQLAESARVVRLANLELAREQRSRGELIKGSVRADFEVKIAELQGLLDTSRLDNWNATAQRTKARKQAEQIRGERGDLLMEIA